MKKMKRGRKLRTNLDKKSKKEFKDREVMKEKLTGLTEQQTKNIKKTIIELCKPLFSIKIVKAIFLYGSSAKHYVPGNDIDILVIKDDTKEYSSMEDQKLDAFIELIREKAEKKGLILHFQPPKKLTFYWDLVRKAEPWVISGLRNSVIIYDPSSYIHLLKKLVLRGELYGLDEKSERLNNRATEHFTEARPLLLSSALELLWVMTEASQIVLSYFDIFTSSATETLKKLKKIASVINLDQQYIHQFDELLVINEKIAKGTLSEFTAREIDLWLSRTNDFISETEKVLMKLERQSHIKKAIETYNQVMRICSKALSIKIKNIPRTDTEKINAFKKELVDKGLISKEYYNMIKQLHAYITKRKPIQEKYLDTLYLKKMEANVDLLELKLRKWK